MTSVVLEEIPDKVTLAVEISNCQGNCVGCHSPFLRDNVGCELTPQEVNELIDANYGINCFLFLGEGNDREALEKIANHIRNRYNLKLALYSGRTEVEPELYDIFDYVKVGPYIAQYGPLNKKTTNQRLYVVEHNLPADPAMGVDSGNNRIEDITYRFWRK